MTTKINYHELIETASKNLKTVEDYAAYLELVEAYLLSEGVK